MDDRNVLEALREGLPSRFGHDVAAVRVDRHITRPYSRVMFCTVESPDGPALRCVAKVVTGPADTLDRQRVLMARDFRVNEHLHAAMGDTREIRVPRPLLFRPELNLIVTEFAGGLRLQDRLVADTKGWPTAMATAAMERECRACGRWIAAFQDATVTLVDPASSFGRGLDLLDGSTCVDQVAICLERLGMAGDSPFTASQESEILRFVASTSAELSDADRRIVGVHGDYFAGNVLCSENATVGIDFIMFRRGVRLVDPSYFLLQLETLAQSLWVRSNTVERLRRAFLAGYDESLDADRFWVDEPAPRMLFVLHRVRRLWGMSGGPAGWHRSVLRRAQMSWIARSLLSHVRRAPARGD